MASQSRIVKDYYRRNTFDWYQAYWHPDHIHLGLFEPGEGVDLWPPLERPDPVFDRALVRMIDEVTAPAAIRAGDHVVDAGCGVGGTARWLASRYGCRVTGVNISGVQLDIARQQTADAGLAELVDFREADCCIHLPFADSAVEVVVNIESACHYADRPRFLCEVRRILKPGGRLAASDWLMTDGISSAEQEAYIRPLCRAWALPDLESPSSYLSLLREAGFETDGVSDFGGRDRHNAELMGRVARIMFMRLMTGTSLPDKSAERLEALSTLSSAWLRGCFELGRYLATLTWCRVPRLGG